MRVYRTSHATDFTVLPNAMLHRRDLSWAALGILAYLVSLPDNNDMTVAKLEGARREGKVAVRAAIAELKAAGYYVKEDRHIGGKLRGCTAVYDVPQHGAASSAPQTADGQTARIQPVSDQPVSPSAVNPLKESLVKETNPLPMAACEASEPESAPAAPGKAKGEEISDKGTNEACGAILALVSRKAPALTLGSKEAAKVAPLLAEWKRRGASDEQIIAALTHKLPHPDEIDSPVGMMLYRLKDRMPAHAPVKAAAPVAAMVECPECGRPGRQAGVCSGCRKANAGKPVYTDDPAIRGAAEARRRLVAALAG